MDKIRTEIGETLAKYATFVYDSENPFRESMGNWLLKLAAWVSPN